MALTAKEVLEAATIQVQRIIKKHNDGDGVMPECEARLARLVADLIYANALYADEVQQLKHRS